MHATALKPRLLPLLLAALVTFGITGCASSQDPAQAYRTQTVADPIEPVNRAIFGFNNVVDMVLIEPTAKVYRFVLPEFARNSVQSFFRNLKSPVILANNLLQGDMGDAGVTSARFVINSTVGIGGLMDVAATQGLKYESEDFGQTLAAWGVGDGMYLVLPIMGPSTLRDTTGMVADGFADPVNLWAMNTDREWIIYTRAGLEGIDARSRSIDAIADMRRNSLDFYAAARSAYIQKRDSLIRDEDPENGYYYASPDFEEY